MADRISSLPDEILCHVLSFLPTKSSVATCVLSKRWKLMWRSVPALNFDDSSYKTNTKKLSYSRFVQSVYTFIISRNIDQPLQRFCLSSRFFKFSLGDYMYMNVHAWVTAAAQCSVQCLDLNCLIDFPSALLSCKTLVILKLTDLNVEALFSVDFPSLKILHLNAVDFSQRKYLAELLSGCPNLEDLETVDITISSFVNEAKFKRLSKLVRAVIDRFKVPLEVVCNVQFLRIDWVDEDLKGIEDRIPECYNLTHFELHNLEYSQDWREMLEVLKHCPKFQNFVIDEITIDDWIGDCTKYVPQCISLNLKICCLNNYKGFDAEFEIAKYILENARQLQDMTICSYPWANEGRKLEMLKKLSLCTRLSSTCKLSFS